MSNYNNNTYGSVEYCAEELKQKTLIASLVKEAVKNRLSSPDNKTPIEELSVAVLTVRDSVKYAEKAVEEAKAKGESNGKPL